MTKDVLTERQHAIQDGPYILDMIIPLTHDAARERARELRTIGAETWEPVAGSNYFTCRHWDELTRLCTAYEDRPTMCRDYPYGGACQHGCSFCPVKEDNDVPAEVPEVQAADPDVQVSSL